jgi:PAT family beta-lactamase induction signal transducer AmpG
LPFKFPVLKESAQLRYFTFFYLYAMQGIPAGFALTAIANFLIGQGVSAITIGSFDAVIGIPWIFQFIWGALIDRYQFSLMGHRKHWIVFSQFAALLVTLSLLLVKNPVKELNFMMIAFFIHSIFASIQDASVDAAAIAIVPVAEQGRVNAFMRSGMLLGVAVGAAGFSTLLHFYGFYYAAAVQSLLLLLFTGLTYLTKIDRSDSYRPSFNFKIKHPASPAQKTENPDLKWLYKQLYKGIVHKKSLRVFGLIALVYLCLSIFIRSFSFHLIHNLHWNDNQLSVLQGTWGSIITIAVTLSGGILADRIGPGKLQLLVVVAICAFFLVFSSLGSFWFHRSLSTGGVLVYSLADPIFSVAAMPVLMALCLAKVEGSQFTTYMAIVNLCDVIGAYVSGWGMSVTSAPVIGVVCGASLLIALVLSRASFRTSFSTQKLLSSSEA